MDTTIKLVVGSIGTILTFLFGGWDLSIQLLLIAIIVDYISGMIRSGIKHKISSEIGFTGILKKAGLLIIIMVGVIADQAMNLGGVLRAGVIYYELANELLSIIENLGQCGVPFPAKLKQIIEKLSSDNEELGNA